MQQIPEQPVQSKGTAPPPKPRKLRWYKRDVDAWRGGTRTMSFELKGFYSECLDAMFDLGGCLPSDPAKLATVLGCNVRIVRRLLPQLIALGKLLETGDGFMNTRMMAELGVVVTAKSPAPPPAPADPPPANEQLSFDTLLPEESEKSSSREAKSSTISTRALDPDPESDSERKITPSPVATRESDSTGAVKRFDLDGLGLGTGRPLAVSPQARRKAAAKLAIANADPLVALYEAWPLSRSANDTDALFIATAPKLYREAAPEVRLACQPIAETPDAPAPVRVARPSSALLASLAKGSRYAVHAR